MIIPLWPRRVFLSLSSSRELWWNTLKDGQRYHYMFSIGWYSGLKDEFGEARFVGSLILLWLSIRLLVLPAEKEAT